MIDSQPKNAIGDHTEDDHGSRSRERRGPRETDFHFKPSKWRKEKTPPAKLKPPVPTRARPRSWYDLIYLRVHGRTMYNEDNHVIICVERRKHGTVFAHSRSSDHNRMHSL